MNTKLLLKRMVRAVRTLPDRRGWQETALVTALFAAVALPLALRAGLVSWGDLPRPEVMLPLAVRVIFVPALFEEILFRVLPNPHPREATSARKRAGAAIGSLAVYVLAHPLVGLILGRPLFTSGAFLLLTALLGGACLLLYLRTGSLWPSVVLHWLTVVSWLAMGGMSVLS